MNYQKLLHLTISLSVRIVFAAGCAASPDGAIPETLTAVSTSHSAV